MKPSHSVTYCDKHDEWSSYPCCACNCLTPDEARKVFNILKNLSLLAGMRMEIDQAILDKLNQLGLSA